jgi:hypothetical protein
MKTVEEVYRQEVVARDNLLVVLNELKKKKVSPKKEAKKLLKLHEHVDFVQHQIKSSNLLLKIIEDHLL